MRTPPISTGLGGTIPALGRNSPSLPPVPKLGYLTLDALVAALPVGHKGV
jgi:hypothetical protein